VVEIKNCFPSETLVVLWMPALENFSFTDTHHPIPAIKLSPFKRHKIKQFYVIDGKEHSLNHLTNAHEKKLGLINVAQLVKYRNRVFLETGNENSVIIKIYPNNVFCAFHGDGKKVF
jgi:hypothetical protein